MIVILVDKMMRDMKFISPFFQYFLVHTLGLVLNVAIIRSCDPAHNPIQSALLNSA